MNQLDESAVVDVAFDISGGRRDMKWLSIMRVNRNKEGIVGRHYGWWKSELSVTIMVLSLLSA